MTSTQSIIVAVSKNGVIGKEGKLPWHYPEDLKWFKTCTFGSVVIMGRNTYLSLKKPLPFRMNIVLTSCMLDGVLCCKSLSDAIRHAEIISRRIFIIGGERAYKEALEIVDKVFLTRVPVVVDDGDTFFPVASMEDPNRWIKDYERQSSDSGLTFQIFKRARN